MTSPYDAQTHLLYVLLDSNLPTGGFVSSSGLESWAKHGFLSTSSTSFDEPSATSSSQRNDLRPVKPNQVEVGRRIVEFSEAEIENYMSVTGCFVKKAWNLVNSYFGKDTAQNGSQTGDGGSDQSYLVKEIIELDHYHEASLLSHVSRRSSKAQGVAMLTLYTKGLSNPVGIVFRDPCMASSDTDEQDGSDVIVQRETLASGLVDAYKLMIRKGASPGHLAVCFGVITAALGLDLEKSLHLYLFLHARSLLSAAVRLNLIGPYLSSQLLLHPIKEIIDRHAGDVALEGNAMQSDLDLSDGQAREMGDVRDNWTWTEEAELGPATTWPLGEVLMARHDQQHSRIFNS